MRAGAGAVTVIDRDYVEESNLQRQSLFDESDVARGMPKAAAAAGRLSALNSDVAVRGVVADLAVDNAGELLAGHTLVLDGTDNFETRFLVNDVCVRDGIDWVYGACVGAYGLALAVRPHVTPCLRCVLEEMPPAGIEPHLRHRGRDRAHRPRGGGHPGRGGSEAADRAHRGAAPRHRHRRRVAGDVRGHGPARTGAVVPGLHGGALRIRGCRGGAVRGPLRPGRGADPRPARGRLDLAALALRLAAVGEVSANEHLLRFSAAGAELVVFRDGRAIVKNVRDVAQARSLYSKYVGS